MNEDSESSDVSRSKRPGESQTLANTNIVRSSTQNLTTPNLIDSGTKKTATKRLEHFQGHIKGDGLFDEQLAPGTTGAMDSSWDEPHNFDDGEHPSLLSNLPTSRASVRDRRKLFDATTPTLVDEEDDAEILTLDQPRGHHVGFNEKDESYMRRTPGASMYKSSFEPTLEEVSSKREAGAVNSIMRSANTLPQSKPTTYLQHTITDQNDSSVLGFGLPLSNPVDVGNLNHHHDNAQRNDRSVWEPHFRERGFSTGSDALHSQRTDSFKYAIKPASSTNSTSSVGSGQAQELRGPFSIGSWNKGTSSKFDPNQYTTQNSLDGRPGTSGAFSPNILRLTEAIGNLLHEDDDDDAALDHSHVFRADTHSDTASLSEDWTGSYVFDNEAGIQEGKPAVPSRSSTGANIPLSQKEIKNRRRATGSGLLLQNSTPTAQPQFSGLQPNTQQPKPRVRTSNEVFEFGKPAHSDSPHILNFGGAFAPPSSVLGNYSSEDRSSYTLPFSTEHTRVNLNPHPQPTQYSIGHTTGNVHVVLSGSSQTIHSTAFDSYQQHAAPVDRIASFQLEHAPYQGAPDILRYQSSGGNLYGSEMQATAREFVPAPRTFSGGSQFVNHGDWQSRPQSARTNQYNFAADVSNWPHSNPGYGYEGNFSHGIAQESSFAPQQLSDHRASLTPSPHLAPWQHAVPIAYQQFHHYHQNVQQLPPSVPQPALVPPPIQLQQHQHSKVQPALSESGLTHTHTTNLRSNETQVSYRGAVSPHLSVAGSEHSQNTAPMGKKDSSKRRQRGKKKGAKLDSPSGKKTPLPQKKKATNGDPLRPSSTGLLNEVHDDNHGSVFEDANDAKRSELIESSATRAAFKEFYRSIRSEERLSFQKAEDFALNCLTNGSLPESVHWRVYLELADLAKRSNRYVEARRLYKMVCQLQPYASQGWLEYSKLEEECGHMNRVMNILHSGLKFCKYSESLLTRAVKHQEKMGNLDSARALLARLKHVGIEKVWRTVLEGALLEARAGNVSTSRRVLKYLMHHVPWYGPLYLEAYRLEKDQGHPLDALQIVERGLQAIPRYGPLWFGAFRLCEDLDRAKKFHDLPQSMEMIERAAASISKELVWKVHLEAAQMLERSAFEKRNSDDRSFDDLLIPARRRLAKTILTCPTNLRWKVWLAAARMELGIGRTDRARELFSRSHEVVPKKGRSSTLLENARLEDFVGDTNLARAILCKGRLVFCHDWKVWLESVLLEVRGGNISRAVEICSNALDVHQGTGRLWATLVQLRQFNGRDEAQRQTLRLALNAVPKSGEVWCEGGRIHLNPFSDTFDIARARRHLFFATRFTPQYGDGFVETIRLELIDQWLLPVARFIWERTKHCFNPSGEASIANSLTKYITDVSLAVAVSSLKETDREVARSSLPKLVHKIIVPEVRSKLKPDTLRDSINLSDLRLACVNADPNYGLLWFHCRRRPTDTPRRIIEDAAGDIATELQKYAHIYLAAIIRRFAVISTVEHEKPQKLEEGLEVTDPVTARWNDYIDEKLMTAPSLEEIFNPIDPTTGLVLLENSIRGPLFVTGLCDLNKHTPMSSLSLAERRRSLFGNDALFP